MPTGSMRNASGLGHYWSITAADPSIAYNLLFDGDNVIASDSVYPRWFGFAVRNVLMREY